jgi:hypothetical protein
VTKAAQAKSWTLHEWADGSHRSWPEPEDPTSGLLFLANYAANSDIRLEWDGAILLPRTSHTAIWKARYFQQTGYYAVAWHTSNDGTWHGSTYEYGTHPYPCDGGVNSAGKATGGTSGSGTDHWFEIAGLGANDFIASPGPGTTTEVIKDGSWLTQARTCEVVSGTTLRHRFYPDVVGAPGVYIQQEQALSGLATPTTPAFILGCSPWTVSGSTNSECPGCALSAIKLFDAALSIADITSEAASGSDSPVTAAGIASVWYINNAPIPTDVTDKSGEGRHPTWANARRPTLWTP